MSTVREFGAALTSRCGAPRGAITTFIEVPFGQDEEAYSPDGVIQVRRGAREWTALVEVKTSTGRLNVEQIEKYVEIARAREYDAVITISNELAGGDADHPVAVDRRKLRKVSLHHLAWDQIRAEAVLVARHRGVADATQGNVLEEFIRYMTHARSGMGGLGDMGPSWVKVREAVKSKTARASDKATGEISARFDELNVRTGSGLLIDARHVLTAAHVVTDMTLDPVVHFDGGVTAPVIAKYTHPHVDVAIVEVDLPAEHDVHRTRGLAFRDPQWADQVTLLGYPPVPQADAPYLTVQTGEVVTPSVTSYFGTEHFLFSATARPGNSGGPVVTADGRVLGIVTQGFDTESNGDDHVAGLKSPFFAGITTSAIVDAFEDLDTCRGLVPVEDWT